MYASESQLPPISPREPMHSSLASSPARRPATNSTGAVIHSPMTMTTSQAYGADPAAVASFSAAGGAVDNASPSSTTTAGEYAEIEQKQVELRSVVENRIMTLERSLRRREKELEALRTQLRKTEEDYQFNYDLIKDRDAALEEAATQLQSMYDDLKRRKSEEITTAKRLEGLEREAHQLRQRLRETEVQREQVVQRLQQAHQLKEKQLKEAFVQKETALEEEKQRLHEEYLRRFKSLDDTQAEVARKSESLAAELEKKWSQRVKRLEEQLSASTEKMEIMQSENVTCEARCTELAQTLSRLKHEHEALQQQHQIAMTESVEKQRDLEAKLNECSAIMGQGIATAEDSIRQQTRRATKLEMECGKLQAKVTELQERLQATRLQQEEDTKRFMEESREMQERYRQAATQAEEQRRVWSDTERELRLRSQRLQSELEDMRREGDTALSRLGEWQNRYESSEKERVQCEQELERLRREIQRCREEEQRTAAHAQESQRVADEKVRSACRKVEVMQEEEERLKKRLFEMQERAQSEEARLARELHASEAARRALEEHFHLAEDKNGQRALLEGLRREKEVLERKVLELERTNAAIREQVASFTIELQNDPAVKAAKETQRRVQELQEELLRARDDIQRLSDVVREKEEELSHYQLEILRARSTETAALHQREQQDHRLREENQNVKEAYERTRHALKSLQQQRQKQEKRCKASSRKPVLQDDDRSSDSDRDDIKGSQERSEKKAYRGMAKDKELLRDGELWRQKCLQLEQHLRDLLRERDRLTKELHLTHQDVDALTNEKQSLVDLNSLLKAQLREAYRTALEYPRQASPPPSPQQKQQRQQQHHPVTLPQQTDLMISSSRSEARESSQLVPPLAVDGVFSRTAAPQTSVNAERLAALEGELAAMKAHVLKQRQSVNPASAGNGGSTTTSAGRGPTRKPLKSRQQQQQQQQSAPTSRTISRSAAPIVHRGSSVVRHYGYL